MGRRRIGALDKERVRIEKKKKQRTHIQREGSPQRIENGIIVVIAVGKGLHVL